jgi:membrane protease YdiL (CAAX protease family)
MNVTPFGRRLAGVTRSGVFVGPNGIRAGWRFLCFVALWMLLDHLKNLVVWYHLLKYKDHPLWHPLDFLVWDGPEFLVTLLTAFLMMKLVDRGRWRYRNYGLGLQSQSFPLFLEGMLWGFLAPTILILLLYFANAVSFEGFALSGTLMVNCALFWFLAMILDGLHDQFLFRGYPLFTLATGMGFWPASIVLSIVFGGLFQYMATRSKPTFVHLLSASLIFLFSCLSFRRTGSLWFAVGFHAMFLFSALVLYGLPDIGNRGKSVYGHLLNLRFHGPPWLTGGRGGAEASILVLPVLVALFLVFDRRHREAVFFPERSGRTERVALAPDK